MKSASKPTVKQAADEIRTILRRDGSAKHAAGVQWFFKEEIKSHGWRTADLRRFAAKCRSAMSDHGSGLVVRVADQLFSGRVLEEKVFAVLLLEKLVDRFDEEEFVLFESWLDRITSWADHDGLVHYLIAPLIAAEPRRADKVFQWAQSSNRWYRRAACVGLIQGTRKRKFFPQVVRLSNMLLTDEDDMVQKGLGWLLRETVKADPKRTIPYLLKIRKRAPRLVLRTACETLTARDKAVVLG